MFVQTVEQLGDEIASLAASLSAATARWLDLVAEFDAREGWAPGGFNSCAHWVAWNCAISPVAAREHVRVARRLRDLPAVAEAFRRGELSYSKARALTRVEEVADEPELVELARSASAAQLEQIVRGYRSVLAVEEGEARLHAERSVTWHFDDDGSLVFRGRLPAETGALLVSALEAARDRLDPPPTPGEVAADASAEAPEQAVAARNADALLALAETSLDAAAGSASADRYQVVVHVDANQLAARPEESGRCELDQGIPLPREAARRLACDASLVRIVERDGRPLSVGRRTRSIPPAMRRALRSRDRGCAFPGCWQRHRVDAHHIEHWADGGRTDLSNLVLLCRHHHRLVHEGGYAVGRSGRELVFYGPDGHALPSHPRRRGRDTCHAVPPPGRPASAEALRPRGFGDPLRLGDAVDALFAVTPPRRE